MDRGPWGATVRGVAESQTGLSDWAQHGTWRYPQAGVPLRGGARVDGRSGSMGFYLTGTRERRRCLACCLVSGDNVEPALE